MGTLSIHQNILVSDTKLMPSRGINLIIPDLVMDKLIPVKSGVITTPPKMSLQLEVKLTPAVTIKLRLILVTHMDNLSRNKMFS